MRIEEFEPEKAWWENREESEFAWKVPLQVIKDSGYNLDIKNPNTPDDTYRSPVELLAEFEAVSSETASLRHELRHALADALGVEA